MGDMLSRSWMKLQESPVDPRANPEIESKRKKVMKFIKSLGVRRKEIGRHQGSMHFHSLKFKRCYQPAEKFGAHPPFPKLFPVLSLPAYIFLETFLLFPLVNLSPARSFPGLFLGLEVGVEIEC